MTLIGNNSISSFLFLLVTTVKSKVRHTHYTQNSAMSCTGMGASHTLKCSHNATQHACIIANTILQIYASATINRNLSNS